MSFRMNTRSQAVILFSPKRLHRAGPGVVDQLRRGQRPIGTGITQESCSNIGRIGGVGLQIIRDVDAQRPECAQEIP